MKKPFGKVIYFDNAATSWPKPPQVAAAMTDFMERVGANPGRSGHRLSIESARLIFNARERVAQFFHATNPQRVVFGLNITESINLALHGLLRPGDHVITSGMEHNSMMRPLRSLEATRVDVTVVPCSRQGILNPADVEAAIRRNTVLLAINHASNVCGTLLPVAEIGQIARRHNLLLLTDEAQTAGAMPVDMQADQIDLLAFTGHKSLYGPMGTGGLLLGDRVEPQHLKPLMQGGTGSRSEQETQPEFTPDRYESGTLNAVGLAGLEASLQWLQARGMENIRTHEMALCQQLIEGLSAIPSVTIHGPADSIIQTATVSFTIAGMPSSEVGLRLDEEFGILCRVGLHCAPSAHRTLGTFPDGTIRFGLGVFNTHKEVDFALEALCQLAGGKHHE